MTNLFAYRATDPRKMKACHKPIGTENDKWLIACAKEARVIIAAWGDHGEFMGRNEEVLKLIDGLDCLKFTKHHNPSHPLYLPYTLRPDFVGAEQVKQNRVVERQKELSDA